MFRRCLTALLLILSGALAAGQEMERSVQGKAGQEEDGPELIRERVRLYLSRHGDNDSIDPERRLRIVTRDYTSRRAEEASRRLRPQGAAANNWISLGPSNGAGRVTAIAPHPSAAGTVYIGAAGGGVWKTTDGGASWTALTDGLNDLSVGALAIAPSSPDTLYLGTGEGGYAIDFIPGIGLLKSTDGGGTWSLPASVIASKFYKISVHPANPQELVAGTNQGGLRSTDGGATWTEVIAFIRYGDVSDIVRHPGDPQILYAATWCEANCTSGVARVLKSTDGGATWVEKSAGLPQPPQSSPFRFNERLAIAISPSNPFVLYAATGLADAAGDVVSHIYKTTDGGETWNDLPAVPNSSVRRVNHYLAAQSWYNNTIVVSPFDSNLFFAGGTNYVRSADGGLTVTSPNLNANVHVDAHELRYQGTALYIGNDGGVWTSPDNGLTASDRNTGLVIRQYYAIASDPVNRSRILAGSQDNGTGQRQDAGGTAWRGVVGGDGFECGINPIAPGIAYATVQFGSVRRSKNAGGINPNFTLAAPSYAAGESPPFLSVLTIHPTIPSTIYTGSHRLWRSANGGDTWVPMPTTTTDGSIWLSSSTISAIAVSRSDPSVLMVSKSRTLFRSTNGGNTWVTAANGLPNLPINNLEIDPKSAVTAYAALATTSGTSLYRTTDGGATWTPRSGGLPNFSAQVVRVDPSDSNVLYCGTDVGVYRSLDQGGNWEKFGTGLPNSSVHDVRISDDGSLLRVATHGRGAWELEIPPSGNTPPAAVITSPAAGMTVSRGAKITFSGIVSDVDGPGTVAGVWSFSDTWEAVPAESGASSVSHFFTRPGVYPVTLAARDASGALGAASVTVTVTDPSDGCATPVVLPGAGPFPYSSFVNSETATTEGTDPIFSCAPAAFASLWFEFTPGVSGDYEFSTCGTAVDTVLSVYTGAACGPYTLVGGCNDDAPAGSICGNTGASVVTVPGNAGETLRILASGFNTASIGNFALTVRPVTTPDSAPRVTGTSLAAGPSSGGSTLTVSGAGFEQGATVTIGGIPATSVAFVDSGNVNVTAPAHGAGPVEIAVTNPGGASGRLANAFTYTPSPAGGPCVAGATILCVNGGRFRVQVTWRAPALGTSGVGMAMPLTGDTGYFWFFSPNNIELVLKAVDGRAFNDRFWVFYGALSDVEYVITVTDTATGAIQAYFNPSGQLASVADTAAFASAAASAAESKVEGLSTAAFASRTAVERFQNEGLPDLRRAARAACSPDATTLCLNANRFQVRVSWRVPPQGTSGAGQAVPLTSDTGYLWFFSDNNIELIVKVVDGRPFNNKFWVFFGALSNVEYTITVTDTETGAVKTYVNPFGTLSSIADTAAF